MNDPFVHFDSGWQATIHEAVEQALLKLIEEPTK